MAHTIRYFNGFEDQETDGGHWSAVNGGGGMTLVSDASLSDYAVELTRSGNSGYWQMRADGLNSVGRWGASQNNYFCWVSFHLKVTALPGAGQYYWIAVISDETTARCKVRIDENGYLNIFSEAAGTYQSSAAAIATDTWYVISVHHGPSMAPYVVARDRDSGEIVAEKQHSSAVGSGAGTQRIYVGQVDASTGTAIFDNIVLETAATDAEIDDIVSLLGTRYAVGMQHAAGDGYYGAWAGAGYTALDEVPEDDTTTEMTETTNGDMQSVTLTPTADFPYAVGTVAAICAIGRFRRGAGSTRETELFIRSSGTDQGTGGSDDSGASYMWRGLCLMTDPGAGSTDWTVSQLDSLEVVARAAGGSGTCGCTVLYNNVLYSATDLTREPKVAYQLDALDLSQTIKTVEGRTVDYAELEAGEYLHLLSTGLPAAGMEQSLADRDDVIFLEAVTYEQTLDSVTVDVEPTVDNFVERLIERLAEPSGGL